VYKSPEAKKNISSSRKGRNVGVAVWKRSMPEEEEPKQPRNPKAQAIPG
jgi:hypothetical protein